MSTTQLKATDNLPLDRLDTYNLAAPTKGARLIALHLILLGINARMVFNKITWLRKAEIFRWEVRSSSSASVKQIEAKPWFSPQQPRTAISIHLLACTIRTASLPWCWSRVSSIAAPLFWKGGFPADKTSQTAKLMQPARKLNQWFFWYEPCTDYYVQTCEQTWLDSSHLMKAARHSLWIRDVTGGPWPRPWSKL